MENKILEGKVILERLQKWHEDKHQTYGVEGKHTMFPDGGSNVSILPEEIYEKVALAAAEYIEEMFQRDGKITKDVFVFQGNHIIKSHKDEVKLGLTNVPFSDVVVGHGVEGDALTDALTEQDTDLAKLFTFDIEELMEDDFKFDPQRIDLRDINFGK